MKRPSAFMRFYSCPKDEVHRFVKAVKPLAGYTEYQIRPLTSSVNPILPTGDHWEATLYFDTEAKRNTMRENQELLALYQLFVRKYAPGRAVVREPGMPSWQKEVK